MDSVGAGIPNEEKQQAHEHHGMMCKQHHAQQEGQMHDHHDGGNCQPCHRCFTQAQQLISNEHCYKGCIHKYGNGCLPAKGLEHVCQVPTPSGGHHQHGRCREWCERATNGNIHKQDAQRGVLQTFAGLCRKYAVAQHQRSKCHCCGLGDP